MTLAESDGRERWLTVLKLPCPPTTVPVTAAWAWGGDAQHEAAGEDGGHGGQESLSATRYTG
ncbi:hypothetical protein GCM10020000_07440 [Streptomyces olivoverticillatus]